MQGYTYIPKSGLAIAGFVCGIVGFVFSIFLPPFGAVVGLVGLILSLVGLGQIKQRGLGGKGLAIAGIILGGLAIVYCCVFYLILAPAAADVFNQINEGLSNVN